MTARSRVVSHRRRRSAAPARASAPASRTTAARASGPSPSIEPRTNSQRPARVLTRARAIPRARWRGRAGRRSRSQAGASRHPRRARRATGGPPRRPPRSSSPPQAQHARLRLDAEMVSAAVEEHRAAEAVREQLRERGEQARVGGREVRRSRLAEQHDGAPRRRTADEDAAQLVPEPVGTAQLAMAAAPLQHAAGGDAEAPARTGARARSANLLTSGSRISISEPRDVAPDLYDSHRTSVAEREEPRILDWNLLGRTVTAWR